MSTLATQPLPSPAGPNASLAVAADNVASAADALAKAVNSPVSNEAIAHAAAALNAAAASLTSAAAAAAPVAAVPTAAATPAKTQGIGFFARKARFRPVVSLISVGALVLSGLLWAASAYNQIGTGVTGSATPQQVLEALENATKYNWVAACFSAISAIFTAILIRDE